MLIRPYRTALVLAVLGVVVAVALSQTPMSPITDWAWIAGFVAAGSVIGLATRPSRTGPRSPTWSAPEDPYSKD
ncbi:hypothetical protein [Aquipuribacter sp. MA13-6]|uniref:hypothetical protein n=1 Tax=unclassified Aquipuribacter TaxID=2635084 RepID=UPI003EE8C894